jgi:hypothetical protein
MAGERLLRILARLSSTLGAGHDTAVLDEVAAPVVAMSGAAITPMSGDVSQESLSSSNGMSALVEDLQYTRVRGLASTPISRTGRCSSPTLPIHTPPAGSIFTPAVASRRAGRDRVSTPCGCRGNGGAQPLSRPAGALTADQHADSLVTADVAAKAVIALQAQASPGSVAVELEVGGDFHLVVHQASGTVSAPAGRERR